MPDPDYKALCAELLADYDNCHYRSELSDRARASLAQPDPISELVSQCRPLEPEMAEYLTPQARWRLYGDEAQPDPAAPTDEELVNFRNRATGDCCASRSNNGANLLSGDDLAACQAAGLRAVLARWGTPANNTGGTH